MEATPAALHAALNAVRPAASRLAVASLLDRQAAARDAAAAQLEAAAATAAAAVVGGGHAVAAAASARREVLPELEGLLAEAAAAAGGRPGGVKRKAPGTGGAPAAGAKPATRGVLVGETAEQRELRLLMAGEVARIMQGGG